MNLGQQILRKMRHGFRQQRMAGQSIVCGKIRRAVGKLHFTSPAGPSHPYPGLRRRLQDVAYLLTGVHARDNFRKGRRTVPGKLTGAELRQDLPYEIARLAALGGFVLEAFEATVGVISAA